jgi:type VI protein secretion system component Hcp
MSDGDTSIFMCFADVRGEAQTPGRISKAPASGGWMRLLSVEFAGQINYGQRTGTHATGSTDAAPLRIAKETDGSSTGMLRNALLGTHDKGVAIIFLRTGDGAAPQEYMRVELENAGIRDYELSGGADDRSIETYSIAYGTMTLITWAFDGTTRGAQAVAIIENRPS